MDTNQKLALEMLDAIDRARGGHLPLEALEEKLFRLLDATEPGFPLTVASRVEDLVLGLRRLQEENLAFHGQDSDENRGAEELYNEVAGELGRVLG